MLRKKIISPCFIFQVLVASPESVVFYPTLALLANSVLIIKELK